MKVLCPSCDARLTVPDSALGRAGRCPSCGTYFYVDQAGDVPVESLKRSSEWDSTHGAQYARVPAAGRPEMMILDGPTESSGGRIYELRISDSRTFGPVDRVTLDQWYAERRIGADSWIRVRGQDWFSAVRYYPELGRHRSAFPRTDSTDVARGQGWFLLFWAFGSLFCMPVAPVVLMLSLGELWRVQRGEIASSNWAPALVAAGLSFCSSLLMLLFAVSLMS